MKTISILVTREAVLASIVDPRYMFTAVNDFLIAAGQEPMFNVQLTGLQETVELNKGAFAVHTDILLNDANKSDLVLIPALSGNIREGIENNREFLPWIRKQYEQGAEVASLCIGAFLLAATGLLDGKKCSTHWIYANEFREMFPNVTLVDDRIITEEDGLFSSGGASSYWNLLLYLIERYTGREMAIRAS